MRLVVVGAWEKEQRQIKNEKNRFCLYSVLCKVAHVYKCEPNRISAAAFVSHSLILSLTKRRTSQSVPMFGITEDLETSQEKICENTGVIP